MALGDIQIYSKDNGFGYVGEISYAVATTAGGASINAGEPTIKAIATGTVVAPMATNSPTLTTVATNAFVGIAATTSTETATLAGTVSVTRPDSSLTYLVTPKVASTWGMTAGSAPVQSTYDALVGARVLMDLTSSSYKILATDSSANGLVIEPLDIVKFPGKVRFSVRNAFSYLA